MMTFHRVQAALAVVACVAVGLACSPSPVDARADRAAAGAADSGAEETEPPLADHVEIARGVPDRGRDPAVVAIDVGGVGLCSGALVSPRIVLTARHCVSRTVNVVACPPNGVQVLGDRAPSSLSVLVGETFASARVVAHGLAVVAPAGVTLCDADIALLLLDEPVTLVKSMAVGTHAPAIGDHVRAVGFGKRTDHGESGAKYLREHVRVLAVTAAEFTVGESTCQGDSGGPAIDEDTGEIVGVVSRGGQSCTGSTARNVYMRVDAYGWLVEEAFARLSEIDQDERADGGASHPAAKAAPRGTKSKPPSDVGGPCEKGTDCAAGVCILDGARRYCSRLCGKGDRCPNKFHCESVRTHEASAGPISACVAVD